MFAHFLLHRTFPASLRRCKPQVRSRRNGGRFRRVGACPGRHAHPSPRGRHPGKVQENAGSQQDAARFVHGKSRRKGPVRRPSNVRQSLVVCTFYGADEPAALPVGYMHATAKVLPPTYRCTLHLTLKNVAWNVLHCGNSNREDPMNVGVHLQICCVSQRGGVICAARRSLFFAPVIRRLLVDIHRLPSSPRPFFTSHAHLSPTNYFSNPSVAKL